MIRLKEWLRTTDAKILNRWSWVTAIIAGAFFGAAMRNSFDLWIAWLLIGLLFLWVTIMLAHEESARVWREYKEQRERYDKALEEHRARRNNGTWTEDQL